MTSLTSEPLAGVIEQLFRDAARTRAVHRDRMGDRPGGPRGGQGDPQRDSREFFARAKDLHLAVSPRTGTLLYMLARTRARAVVEFGTSFGVSILHLAAAVKDNGGGVVIGTEFEPGKVAATRRSVEAADLGDIVEIREGDARETPARGLPDAIDLVFLDRAKDMYVGVLQMLEPGLAPGALVVADNADHGAGYLDHVRSCGRYLSADVGGNVEVSLLG
jgi:predicted O-methyltransferase YrrM